MRGGELGADQAGRGGLGRHPRLPAAVVAAGDGVDERPRTRVPGDVDEVEPRVLGVGERAVGLGVDLHEHADRGVVGDGRDDARHRRPRGRVADQQVAVALVLGDVVPALGAETLRGDLVTRLGRARPRRGGAGGLVQEEGDVEGALGRVRVEDRVAALLERGGLPGVGEPAAQEAARALDVAEQPLGAEAHEQHVRADHARAGDGRAVHLGAERREDRPLESSSHRGSLFPSTSRSTGTLPREMRQG